MDTNKPMALRLADKYEHEGFLSDHKFAQNQWCYHAAVELRRLHAENESLSNKLQTFEALGGAVDDLQLLRTGYAAARLEIASLQSRLEASQKTNDDWAKRTHAMDAKNLGLLHALTAEQDENHALHQQLAAIGAGGVEPLRKRECLHSISEPAPSEWDVRGRLAASLTCWPRLTGQEAAELVALLDRRPYPPLPDCKYTQSGDIKDFGLYSTAQMLAYVAADRAACYEAQAAPVDAELMRDAKRYRWLRDMNDWHSDPRIDDADGTKWQLTFYTPQSIEEQSDDDNYLDSAIDAAIAAQGGV